MKTKASSKQDKNEYVSNTDALDNYSKGWKLFKAQWGILLGVVLLLFVLNIISSSFKYLFPPIYYQIINIIFALFIVVPISIGANLVALRLVRKERTDVADIFELFKTNYRSSVLAGFLTSLFIIVGLILLIIPGILIAIRLSFVSFLIADKKMKAMDAIKESWRMTKGHGVTIFLTVLLGILITIAGIFILFVGVIPASMWVTATFAVLYHSVSKKKK